MKKRVLLLKLLKSLYLSFLILTFCSYNGFAGETGKISGRVTDKQTGESLPGVNMIVMGTTMGAAADDEGRYFILNIPPGIYELKASAIGYHSLTITAIKVKSDLTTEVNIQLESTVIETPVQGLIVVTVNCALPVQPAAVFAVIVCGPAARLEKVPDG